MTALNMQSNFIKALIVIMALWLLAGSAWACSPQPDPLPPPAPPTPTPPLEPVPEAPPETPSETPASVGEFLSRVAEAVKSISSYSYTINATANRKIQQDGEAREFTTRRNSTTLVDIKNQRMKMVLTNAEVGKVNGEIRDDTSVTIAIIIDDDKVLVGEAEAGSEIEWEVTPESEEMLELLSQIYFLTYHLELLNQAEVRLLPDDEFVRNINCYVVDVKPEANDLINLIVPSGVEARLLLREEPEYYISSLIDDYTYRLWYEKDTDYLVKLQQHMKITLPWGEDKMELVYEWDWEFEDYNQPLSIQLPAVAEKPR